MQLGKSADTLLAVPAIGSCSQLTGTYMPVRYILAVLILLVLACVSIAVPAAKKLGAEEGLEPPKM